MSDKLLKLFFEHKSCRAEVLHLDDAWVNMVKNQNLPTVVKHLLGEMVAAATMLAAGLKFDGTLILQLQGDGPVKLALVEIRSGLTIRATAQLRSAPESLSDQSTFKELVNANGNGRCALILDMADRKPGEQPYQGVVSLEGESVAETIENYMTQSEQLQTRLWLFANDRAAGGLLLQKVAATGGKETVTDENGFESLALFAKTVKAEEILTLEPEEVARRLFWEESPRIMGEFTPTFACRCSQAGIEGMVKSLGYEEAAAIVRERGKIEVTCEFCGAHYVLDSIDVECLFHPEVAKEALGSKH